METCFSEGKLIKQIGNPPFLREPPPFQLTPISEQFFHGPPLCLNFKSKNPTPPLILGGGRKLSIG